MSLRYRIVVAIILVLISGAGSGLALAGLQARYWLRGELTSAQVSGELAVTRAYSELKRSSTPRQDLGSLIETFDGNRHLQAVLLARDGRVLAVSRLAPATPSPGWFSALLRQQVEPVRLPDPLDSGVIVELRPVYTNDIAAVWPEFLDLALVLAVSSLGGAALAWLVVGRALEPLRTIGQILPRIGGGDYAAKAPERGPPELVELARGVNEMAERLGAMRSRNRVLEEQILTLQDEERADIARDLHDEIGPHLFAANVDVAVIASLAASGRTEAVLEQVRAVQDAIAHIQRRVRDILGRLRPTQLVELGLAAAVLELTAFWRARRPEVRFQTEVLEDDADLPEAVQETAYRVVQESLSNAIRHGAPRAIEVTVERSAAGLRVEVRNDGAPAAPATPGLGLTGMTERVAAVGGVLAAGPADAGGWRVSAILPLLRAENGQAA